MAAFDKTNATLVTLTTSTDAEERAGAAKTLFAEVEKAGFTSLENSGLVAELKTALEGSTVAKEGGALLFDALSVAGAVPYLVPLLDSALNIAGVKKCKVASKTMNATAVKFAKVVGPYSTMDLIPGLLTLATETTSWQVKVAVLEMLEVFSETAPLQLAEKMVEIVPVVSGLMWETKKQVKTQAKKSMIACCNSIDNRDLEPFIPALISAITHPEEVMECVHALASTTFVQAVDASALSVTVPVLDRGFKERATATKRRCAVITENMAKLVVDPAHVATFMPVLEPHLARAKEEVADPECRSRCAAAHEALQMVNSQDSSSSRVRLTDAKLKPAVEKALAKAGAKTGPILTAFIVKACIEAVFAQNIDEDDYVEEFEGVVGEAAAKAIFASVQEVANAEDDGNEVFEEEDDDVEQLCDCKFSLAYGAKILLNNARLKLKRGKRYGIVAQKSAGKTTLLRSISRGQVEGFPVNTLKTVFVEHDIQGSQVKMSVLDFTLDTTKDDPVSKEYSTEEWNEKVSTMLTSIGFTDTMKFGPIASLSGGWKMKLGLARAILRKADILLLDEPTNHLDVLNVQWVVDYLTGEDCAKVTSLIVSHDTKFLDNVATNIMHFNALKLNNYLGNLSKFVERFPEAKAYYELGNTKLKFSFPQPGPLDGVKSKGRAIMTMKGVQFTYPGAEKPQLYDVNIKVSMASKIACVGANGAGKSTMIKLLTGEMKPSKGIVFKHPNCRFAYVAQHAFHHIEQHLDKTANEYIQWRYQGGEDKEAMVKSTAVITDEERKKMEKPLEFKYTHPETGKEIKEKRVVEKIVSRRKNGKVLEYEVKWRNKTQDLNTWYNRDKLIDMGFEKLLKEVDRRKAAQEGAYARVLSQRNVEKHLEAVGLDAELGTHNRIKDLSGGQKVKVVLAACTWAQPHLIILDEPTNYLDRESLGALANAINDFEGGCVLITHNKEFADKTTRETWVVANNRCDVKGDAEWEKYAQEQLELAAAEDQVDGAGNIVEVKSQKTPDSLKPREKKKMIKELKFKIKNDDEMTDFEEECASAWGLFEGN